MTFGEKLKELREALGLTQEQLAKKVQLSKPNICKYEKGSVEPNIETILKFSEIFDVSSDYLLGKTDDPSPKSRQDITFDDFTYAMYDETKELTEEDKEALLNMARILKKKTESSDN